MSAFEKITNVVKSIAPAVANTFVPGSGLVLETLMRAVTGDKSSPIEEVANKIEADPALFVALKQSAMQKEIELARIEADRIESVNQTMRVEAKQHPWAGMWRPFWGFISAIAFLICVVGIIGLGSYGLYKGETKMLEVIPSLVFSITSLFGIPGAILGVASWHRGKQKRVEAGEQFGKGPGLVGIIQAVRGGK